MIVSYRATVLQVGSHKARQQTKDTDSTDEFPEGTTGENKSEVIMKWLEQGIITLQMI